MTTRSWKLPVAIAATLLLAACSSSGASPSAPAASATAAATTAASAATSAAPSAAAQTPVTLRLAHSYTDAQPQAACGAKVIKDTAEAAGVGLTINIFGGGQLGSDADRVTSVAAGDIDMDIQGASALSNLYAPIAPVDGAFVFDDSEHMYRFFSGPASDELKKGFFDATTVTILGGWNTGARQFTANKPILTPADLQGLKMRFPPSKQFLMNAAAMGASPVEVAYDELYVALQQKVADGQENPLVNIKAINLPEVQSHISLSSHQLSSNLVIISKVWATLSPEQQAALKAAVEKAMVEEPKCVVIAEKAILDEFKTGGKMQVVDTVDRDAFRLKAEPYLKANFTPEQVKVLEAIRSTAN